MTESQAALPKRFYTSVSVVEEEGGFAVRLDGRSVRTPGRRPLVVPTRRVAEALAAEWDRQEERIDPATMPLARLANTVVDGVGDDPIPIREDLKRYGETDLLFYRADAPGRLAERQRAAWDPVLRDVEASLGALFLTSTGIMHVAQPRESLAALAARLDRVQSAFELAALHQITTLTGSVLLALTVYEGHLDASDAWRAAHVDEDWNIEQWGEDQEAAARRARRFRDMEAAALMLGR